MASVGKPGNGFWLSPSSKLRQPRVKHAHSECPCFCRAWDWRSLWESPKDVCEYVSICVFVCVWCWCVLGVRRLQMSETIAQWASKNLPKKLTPIPGNPGLSLKMGDFFSLSLYITLSSGFLQFLSRILDIPAINFKGRFSPRQCSLHL